MKSVESSKACEIILIGLLFFTACKPDSDFEERVAQGNNTTSIWVSFDDVLYGIEDVRVFGQDYSTPVQMEIIDEINLGGVNTSGVRAGSFSMTYGDALGQIYTVPLSNVDSITEIGTIGGQMSAPFTTGYNSHFIVSSNGRVQSLNFGFVPNWEVDLGEEIEIYASPCFVHTQFYPGRLVLGASDGIVRSLNTDNGLLDWSYTTGGAIHSNPIRFNRVPDQDSYDLIVGSDDGLVYSLRGLDGTLVWQFETGGAIRSSPTVNHWTEPDSDVNYTDPLVYFGSDDHKVYAVNPLNGDLRWEYQTGGAVRSSPYFLVDGQDFFAQEGLVIVGSDDGKVYCFQSHTGILEWSRDLGSGPIQSSPVGLQNVEIRNDVSRNTVYVSTSNGLFGLDAESGRILSQIDFSAENMSSPVVLLKYDDEYWQGPWYPSVHSVFYY